MDRPPVVTGIAIILMSAGAAIFLAVVWSDVLVGAPRVAAGDHQPRSIGFSCSRRAWPYYDTVCLRDLRRQDGNARAVRIVATGSSSGHIKGLK